MIFICNHRRTVFEMSEMPRGVKALSLWVRTAGMTKFLSGFAWECYTAIVAFALLPAPNRDPARSALCAIDGSTRL